MPIKTKIRENQVFWLKLASISTVIYITWRVIFTIPIEHGLFSRIAGTILIIAEIAEAIEAFGNYRTATLIEEIELPMIPDSWYPDVDILIATHNEPVKLLFKTINGCKLLKYPDKNKIHIYLCDDSNRPEMKRLAKTMQVGYFGLEGNKDAKAGNLNHALSKTNSPLVVTFDADMIPISTFLIETIPYFFLPFMEKNKKGCWKKRKQENQGARKIGFIQTPQSFYNPDLFQYNLHAEKKVSNEQDYFFQNVNVKRNHTNTPIYAGSNTVISREALMEVGGIRTGTVTEDFATGIAIQAAGYTCYATSKPLAHGLSPTDIKSLIKQRQRWGRGCVHTLKSKEFLMGKLPFLSKLSYLQCLLYWWTFTRRFIYLVSPILFTVFGIYMVDCRWWELVLFWLPNHLLGAKAMKLVSGGQRSQRWSNLVDTIMFPYLILPVIAETIGIREKRFAVTEKQKKLGQNSHVKYAVVHLILMIGSMLGLYRCFNGINMRVPIWKNFVLIYWLVINLYYLTMAVRFLVGRKNERQEERIPAKEKVELITQNGRIKGWTLDISESGMSVITEQNLLISNGEELEVSICTKDYKAKLRGRVARSLQEGDRQRYGISFQKIPDKEKEAYYGIIYDRDHIHTNIFFREQVIFSQIKEEHSSNQKIVKTG